MRGILDATAITSTELARAELESLARSMKVEHRLRLQARIIFLASDGAATRRIARTVGCTIGAASKWRFRYAAKRMAGFDDTGPWAMAASVVDRSALPRLRLCLWRIEIKCASAKRSSEA